MRFLLALVFCLIPIAAHSGVAERGTLTHGGIEREHYLFVPKGVESPALVVALHGMGGNAKNLRFGIGLTKRAAAHGFAVVYPQGLRLQGGSRHWNAGFDYEAVDDVGYLTALINHLANTQGIDSNRVFVLGLSMGGYMAYHMACRGHVPLAGITSVAGRISGRDWKHCPAEERPSLLHIHGVQDHTILYTSMQHWGDTWGGAPSVPVIMSDWAKAIGAAPVHVPPEEGLVQRHYRNEATGAQVRMIALEGFGHDWPSTQNSGYSAVETIVDFFGLSGAESPLN
ncbi:MAG: PHB depolymerase family esterase [Pseudomonadota bacterium]